jgi:taurine dioxygenase
MHSRSQQENRPINLLQCRVNTTRVGLAAATAGWHSDVTFAERPPMASILRGVEIPAFGGDTMWSSCSAAYDALSAPMQRFLEGLSAVHDTAKTFSRDVYPSERHADAKQAPRALHPVLRTHPETGRKALFVNPAFTSHLRGLRREESAALLEFLYRHMTTPELTCRFRWEKNSLAIWDNRCTQHRVVADNLAAPRRMERVTVEGDRPA